MQNKSYRKKHDYRIGNFEIFKVVYPDSWNTSKARRLAPNYTKGLCGCHIFEIFGVGITWLSKECR